MPTELNNIKTIVSIIHANIDILIYPILNRNRSQKERVPSVLQKLIEQLNKITWTKKYLESFTFTIQLCMQDCCSGTILDAKFKYK